MTSSLADDRAELLRLLCADGIFHSTEDHPIVTNSGVGASWMLDSLRVSMTARGAELAGRCLLDLLDRFEGRQLATYGVTAIPLINACVTLGGGRYRGLIVRKEIKPYGSQKRIEGPFDPDQPVVIVDDSISSGTSMQACVDALEAAGARVEGGVVLVRFGWYGGFARMVERGLRIDAVYDVHRDLVPIADPDRPRPPANPSDPMPAFEWADETWPDGGHPAALAREVIARRLRGEPVPRPPRRFDRDYDAAGGTWVSVRSQANIHQRHARDGLWVFPGEPPRPIGEDVVRAAIRTATRVPDLEALDGSGIAVTFFGALEPCTVGQLDNERYGIVVRSAERPEERFGGALPRMPGMSREWAQFEHARRNNAKLLSFEPFTLYRHTVAKAIEPGKAWQPTGVPADPAPTWHGDPGRAGRIATRAWDLARAHLTGEPPRTEPVPDDLVPALDGIYVTIYDRGRVAGCMGTKPSSLDADLGRITAAALADARFGAASPERAADLAVTVSLLDDATALGVQTPDQIAIRCRHGEQALMVFQGTRTGVLLPQTVVQHSLSPTQYVAEVIDKAGITRPPYQWGRYDVTTWLADRHGPQRLVLGLPPGEAPATIAAAVETMVPRLVGYLLRHLGPDGLPDGLYRALVDRVIAELDEPRKVFGAWTLARAARLLGGDDLTAAAATAVDAVIARFPDGADQPPLLEATFVLLALCAQDDPTRADLGRALASRLWRAIDRHGEIADPALPAPAGTAEEIQLEQRRREAMKDYLPAQVLLALAAAADRGWTEVDRAAIDRAFRVCRHRIQVRRPWGPVGWLPQAAAAWWRRTEDPALPALAFDVVDWALGYQQDKSGGFINGEQPDAPGCSTAVYLEGVAAALDLATALGDDERAARYRASATAALRFLDGLIYQERDRPLLPDPERAYGGVRLSRTAGDVRIDFVQHALGALLLLRPAA